MICSYCNKVALYQVVGRGYCGDHKKEAVEAEGKQRSNRKAFMIRNSAGVLNMDSSRAHSFGATTFAMGRLQSKKDTLLDKIHSIRVSDFKPKSEDSLLRERTSRGVGGRLGKKDTRKKS